MAKGSSKRWRFSKRTFFPWQVKNGTIIAVDGNFTYHTADGRHVKMKRLVGKKTSDHRLQTFGNKKKNVIGASYLMSDYEDVRVRLRNRRR